MGITYGGELRLNKKLKSKIYYNFSSGWHQSLHHDARQLGFCSHLYQCRVRCLVLRWNSKSSCQTRNC